MGKPAPTFWWDYVDDATAIIVQSDYPGGEELARFNLGDGDASAKAQALIEDYQSGRKTPQWTKPGKVHPPRP